MNLEMEKQNMSTFLVDTQKELVIKGKKYHTDINEKIFIDFSAATYHARFLELKNGDNVIELVPDNMDFLHNLTEIFPLEEYDIRILQNIYRRIKYHVSITFDVRPKTGGDAIYFAETASLTDKDYDHIRAVLIRDMPYCEWQTIDEYIRNCIETYMFDLTLDELFSSTSRAALINMVKSKSNLIKIDGIVDFDDKLVGDTAAKMLEETLKKACEESMSLEK